ncbi:MAG: sensor histidine kinase [Chloroflexota bacterium]|nr:sensor histidine kinase [Chloroflexota bacterium]
MSVKVVETPAVKIAAPAPESVELPELGAPGKAPAARSEPPLSQRVFALQQIIPLLILATIMFYEVTTHLIFENQVHPLLFASEMIIFGIVGPAFTWVTLNWVAREIAKRERAEGKADTLNAMMQETHHRIKNNLQTVVDLLTLEMSRNPRPEVQESLRDSITRIKSIAASHEMLSVEQVGSTDITELAHLVSDTARRSMVRPGQRIDIDVEGPTIFLTSKQATAFALVLNELVSNAIEHGFRDRTEGHIDIALDADGEDVWMRVEDNGNGLPQGFDLATSRGLGLQIARTLVEKDLSGKIGITDDPEEGTTAWVHFGRRATLN